MLECVVNISEGRDDGVVSTVAAGAGHCLLDVHSDPHHHRSVLTLGGPDDELEAAVREVARRTVDLVDLGAHAGAHPRLGALDVVPFVPLSPQGAAGCAGDDLGPAVAARDRFARWAGESLSLPCFEYGPERSLPDVRRRAFAGLAPDWGPSSPHPTAGACAVGARPVLVAYNLWLDGAGPDVARAIAREVRGPAVRALGLQLGADTQVSCNLVDPCTVGPDDVFTEVQALATRAGVSVARAELVGLAPLAVIAAVPATRRALLDLDPARSIEARLEERLGRTGPRPSAAAAAVRRPTKPR